MGDYAFSGTALEQMLVPAQVTELGAYAFMSCPALTAVTVEAPLTQLPAGLFQQCGALTQVSLPETMTALGELAFDHCTALPALTLPPRLTAIGRSAFAGCSGLTALTLPETLVAIGESAFFGCSALTGLVIPEGVTELPYHCLANCEQLTFLTLPHSLSAISDGVFDGAPSVIIAAEDGSWARQWARENNVPCADAARQPREYTIREAMEQGLITVEAHAADINNGNLYVTNNTAELLHILVPAGAYLESQWEDYQNMLLTQSRGFYLSAGSAQWEHFSTACMNLHRAIPEATDGYALRFLEEGTLLHALAALLCEQELTYDVQQAAVWIVTDSAAYADVTGLNRSGSQVIQEEEYLRGQELMHQARERAANLVSQ